MNRKLSRLVPRLVVAAAFLVSALQYGRAEALVVDPFYAGSYSLTDLGAVPGLPTPYGGLTIKAGDPNTLLIGGQANQAAGRIHEIGVTRDGAGHITGFTGSATATGFGTYNDGGVGYGPGGVLFLAEWSVNRLGQVKPGSATEDKITDLTPLMAAIGRAPDSSISAQNFVPAGFPGAGQMKIVTWGGGSWYTAAFSPDGSGTFNIDSLSFVQNIVGGPEGFIYVQPGSPLFPDFDSMLVSEYSSGNIVSYTLDANGNPEPASRRIFIGGLTGAEGAAIDPLTGDFLFSTFGAANHVVVVQGFAPPPPPNGVPEPSTLLLVGAGIVAMTSLRRKLGR